MAEKTVVKNNGIGAMGLLGVVFVTLKLLGITAVAGWSWWLVLLPFYLGLAIMLSVLAVGLLGVGVVAILDKFFVK